MSPAQFPPHPLRGMRLYVAGPMTGLPGLNFPAFNAATLQLRGLGFDVTNPVELNPGPSPADQHSPEYTAHWRQCMRVDIQALMLCSGVALLHGWKGSRGARLEHHIATDLGLIVRPLDAWLSGVDFLPTNRYVDDDEPDILHTYAGTDGRREWWSGGTWVHPGEAVAVINIPEEGGTA